MSIYYVVVDKGDVCARRRDFTLPSVGGSTGQSGSKKKRSNFRPSSTLLGDVMCLRALVHKYMRRLKNHVMRL